MKTERNGTKWNETEQSRTQGRPSEERGFNIRMKKDGVRREGGKGESFPVLSRVCRLYVF
jgi:hypothetical protein